VLVLAVVVVGSGSVAAGIIVAAVVVDAVGSDVEGDPEHAATRTAVAPTADHHRSLGTWFMPAASDPIRPAAPQPYARHAPTSGRDSRSNQPAFFTSAGDNIAAWGGAAQVHTP
jgi:hypothetical protein